MQHKARRDVKIYKTWRASLLAPTVPLGSEIKRASLLAPTVPLGSEIKRPAQAQTLQRKPLLSLPQRHFVGPNIFALLTAADHMWHLRLIKHDFGGFGIRIVVLGRHRRTIRTRAIDHTQIADLAERNARVANNSGSPGAGVRISPDSQQCPAIT